MAHIVLYSIPFGLGPTGKAIVLAQRLSHHHKVVLMTFGDAVHLARASLPYDSVVDCKSRSILAFADQLQGAHMFISVMDLAAAAEVKRHYPRMHVVMVDSLLFWRIQEYPADSFDLLRLVDTYVAQYFLGTDEARVRMFFGDYVSKLHVAKPIVTHQRGCAVRRRSAVLHFGGVSSPVLPSHSYTCFIRKVTVAAQDALDGEQMLVAGSNSAVCEIGGRRDEAHQLRVQSLPYDDFQKELAQATLLITTPGIETVYESMASETPIVLLPPVNSTQLTQSELLRVVGYRSAVPDVQRAELASLEQASIPYQSKTRRLCTIVNRWALKSQFRDFLIKTIRSARLSETGHSRILVPSNLENGCELISSLADRIFPGARN